MLTWLRQMFASPEPKAAPVPARPAAAPAGAPVRPVAATPKKAQDGRVEAGTLLSAKLVEFLDGLVTPAEPVAPEELTSDDVLFLEGLVRRLEAAQLEVAMLPEATLRLTELLRKGDAPITQYVALLNQDTSLSMEVLKAANSAYYAGSARTTNLHEAVMRIGLSKLQSTMMLSLMRSRVLKAGTLRAHAELLIDMSLPLATCAGAVARATGSPVDLCFMRGMLLHVEHLLVLGTIGDTSREHRAIITPSTGALLLAIERSGIEVRRATAIGWALEDIMLRSDKDGDSLDYDVLRRALACKWLRRELPAIDGVPADVLEASLSQVAPRVKAEKTPAVETAATAR